MEPGKILVAEQDNLYLLKFTGDVRVTLCASLNNYIERIFHGQKASSMYVDMLDTLGIDSTTLGLLAKLGIYCRDKIHIRPRIFCTNPDLIRTLESMSIDELFDITTSLPIVPLQTDELAAVSATEEQIRQHVLEAHKLLLELDPNKWGDFVDLIRVLENRGTGAKS